MFYCSKHEEQTCGAQGRFCGGDGRTAGSRGAEEASSPTTGKDRLEGPAWLLTSLEP